MKDSFVVEFGSTRLMYYLFFVLLFAPLIMNDNFNANTNRYSDNELHLMSYQELRRLSILMQLPANIKKKYMISMIKAHQNGDGCTKLAIANKIMEERKVKRLNNKKKSSKSYKPDSPDDSQEVPANLSVTKHEFETRFSYVAHYTAKGEINPGLSQIIKQETEVSRRNRSILQQPRKPTRKLSTVGRREIMLPRNHSLTTPVRLMPQSERGYPPPPDYEAVSGLANAKAHYQNVNSYNYHFHGEFSNSLIPTTTHESYGNEPYWHTREVYTNSLMPILTSLLTPNSVSINSSGYGAQYNSSNSAKETTSFQQGMYEKYIKSSGVIESQVFQGSDSGVSDNTHQLINDTNNYVGRGSYVITKSDVDFEITSALSQINYQHYNRRDEVVTRNSNGNQNCLVDFCGSRNGESLTPQMIHVTNVKDLSQYNGGYCRADDKSLVPVLHHYPFETSSAISYRMTEKAEANKNIHEHVPPAITDYEPVYREENWEEAENENMIEKNRENEYFPHQPQESFLSEVSDNSTDYSVEADSNDNLASVEYKEKGNFQNFPRCRYVMGHNKYPEPFDDLNKTAVTLPSFLNTFFSTNESRNKAYSVCKNSSTGTTEIHLNPIMIHTLESQLASHTNPRFVNNICGDNQMQRPWLHNYSECQAPFSSETTNYASWNEFSNEMDSEGIAQHNGHDVQMVKCRTHGCHYLYSISN